MTSSACHAHLRTCYMKIQGARIAMKLDTDVAETLCVSTTAMILKSSSVLLAYDDVFTCGAQSDRFCQNLSELVRLLKSVRIGQNALDFRNRLSKLVINSG